MRIALAVPSLVPGAGIPNMVVAWANRFATWGHQTAIVTLRNTRTDIRPEVEVYQPIALRRGVRLWRRWGVLRRLLGYPLLRWLRQRRFDIVNVHYPPMDLLLGELRKQSGARFVYTYYGVSEPDLFSGKDRQRRLLEEEEMQRWLPQCHQVIVISRFLQERLRRRNPEIPSVVIPPGIDLEQFRPPSAPPANPPVLLHVGRMSPHKGLHLLLEAFQQVRQAVPEAHLRIIGRHDNDEYWRSLQPQMQQSPQVSYLGQCPQEELLREYQRAAVFTCASLYEGFGLPFLEAQACGLPCVGFACASIPEVVHDGKTGFLVPPGDVSAFAAATIRLLRDGSLRAEMARQARKRAESFGWDGLAQQALREFERLTAAERLS